jgi:hypothetical protein
MLSIHSCPGRRTWRHPSSTRTAESTSPTSSTRRRQRDLAGTARGTGPRRTRDDLAAKRTLLSPSARAAARDPLMVDGSLAGLRLSGLRDPHGRLRLADDQRASLRPLRPSGLRQPLPAHARPPDPADLGLATAGEADGGSPRRAPRLDLSGLAPRAASGPARRARGRPPRAAHLRRGAATGSAERPMFQLQRAEGVESAATLTRG